jgi:hypothetical protein
VRGGSVLGSRDKVWGLRVRVEGGRAAETRSMRRVCTYAWVCAHVHGWAAAKFMPSGCQINLPLEILSALTRAAREILPVLAGNPGTHVQPQEGQNFRPCLARKEIPQPA